MKMTSQSLCFDRRQSTRLAAAGVVGGMLGRDLQAFGRDPVDELDPAKPLIDTCRKLTVQPIFMYRLPVRKEETSWKSRGGVQTEDAAREEYVRIGNELAALGARAGFPLNFLPVARVTSPEESFRIREQVCDVHLCSPVPGR